MDEDEAALLAELRAISNRSRAATRFQDDDEMTNVHPPSDNNINNNEQQQQQQQQQSPQNMSHADMSFVSAKSSSSTDRFEDAFASPSFVKQRPSSSMLSSASSPSRVSMDVPWKKNGNHESSNGSDTVDENVVMVSEEPPALSPPAPQEHENSDNNGLEIRSAPQESEQEQQTKLLEGISSSTFQGERGGVAQDEELLAELRAISAKSSSADRFAEETTADTNDDGGDHTENARSNETVSSNETGGERTLHPKTSSRRNSDELPPWKRKGSKKKTAQSSPFANVDIVVATPPTPVNTQSEATIVEKSAVENVPERSHGIKSSLPSTFQGDRGGVAEDEELLAELRAISAKSSSASRFADEHEDTNENTSNNLESLAGENVDAAPSDRTREDITSRPSPKPKRDSNVIPPWKRGNKKRAQSSSLVDVDIVVAAPPPTASAQDTEAAPPSEPLASTDDRTSSATFGIKSTLPSTFQGERGGAAEDEELLAELRAISAKSSGADRFVEGDETTAGGNPPCDPDVEERASASSKQHGKAYASPSSPKPKCQSEGEIPPWKRGKTKAKPSSPVEVDVVVAAPRAPAPLSEPMMQSDVDDSATREQFGIKESQPSTFKGDRGGAAEDPELLAELRAISMKSSSSDRFAEESHDDGTSGGVSEPATKDSVAASIKKVIMKSASQRSLKETEPGSADLPPWKRGKMKSPSNASTAVVDTVVAAAGPSSTPVQTNDTETVPERFGIKSSLSSTFKGDRGGSAEDEELLAELRAISMQSSGRDRFADESANGRHTGTSRETEVVLPSRASSMQSMPKQDSGQSPPWKRGTHEATQTPVPQKMPIQETPSDPVTLQSSSRPNFQENRGGPAENPSTSAEGDDAPPMVTRETLPIAVSDRNWKMRKEAYILLRSLLAERLKQGEGNGSIQGDSLMPGLDDTIPTIVADNNAGALDAALAFALDYAEHCQSASSSEWATKIVTSLVKGNALSSSRPSTIKCASALALKLMEVGGNGFESVHAVSEVLLAQGLSSRKPKVVIASSTLILDAAYSFGAGTLPLAAISSAAPRMLSHSNAAVRETAVKIIAEICRALGSKTPLQGLIDGMKKAQLSQLDSMLEAQPEPTPVSVGLRSSQGSSSSPSPTDALAALEANSKKLEAKRYAEREAVNILQSLPKTDYSTRIKLPKWSEKVAALDIVLDCGGEQPYKLVQPSSSVNYSSLISEMKTLLSHSHFAVVSKSMKVLSMLAEGVGAGLFPHLRPLLAQLVLLSKDKKLNRAAGECLDTFFGNVLEIEHLLDKDDALPSALNEKAQKNALVRASALDFLGRCIKRSESAGPRGKIRSKSAADAARLCCKKLEDSDAAVRKAATEALRSLLAVEDGAIVDAISPIIDSLQTNNSRAYKSLKGSGASRQTKRVHATAVNQRKSLASGAQLQPESKLRQSPSKPARKASGPSRIEKNASVRPKSSEMSRTQQNTTVPTQSIGEDMSEPPYLEDAMLMAASFRVPSWDAPEDDGGVLAGLKSSKWLNRQNAISHLASFCKTEESPVSNDRSSAILVVVKEHTRGFKETNVNVTKAVIELFIALAEVHAEQVCPFPGWAQRDAVNLAVDKIADRKLSVLSSTLLGDLCCVCPPGTVLESGVACVEKVKSPLGHEAFLKWLNGLLTDFGASSVASVLNNVAGWLLKECESTNIKVRRVALSVAGELHSQLGPSFRALALSSCADNSTVKGQLEIAFDERPFDPMALTMEWPRECVVLQADDGVASNTEGTATSLILDIPKLDLSAALPSDCIENMGSKEGKNAWKLRKQALDDVEAALTKGNGLISTESLKPLVELLRALRERLSDSQSNLKPVSARIIGSILGSVDTQSQSKLGRIVYAPLISAVMSDNRKPMREASMEAIRAGTTASSLEGGQPNGAALEALMVAIVGELNESEFKASGLPDVFQFITGVAEFLPDLDSVASSRAESLGDKFAAVMVGSLTSSKSETRSAAESLLKACVENGKLSLKSIKKGMKHLLPAQQRTVIPIVARLPHPQRGSPNGGKENSVPKEPPMELRQSKPRDTSAGVSTIPSPRARRRAESSRGAEGRVGMPSTLEADSFDRESNEPDDLHPLIATGEPGKKPLSSSRRINWPEHPEEPSSPGQLNALKKLWSRSLPTRSIAALFPTGGIRKQEDAIKGCALLCKAIEKDRTGHEEAIVEHVDVILMWTSFALCSRESTVGLQPIITLLTELFTFLQDHHYKLSDGEANILLPHIFEKASIAKGRFREQFNNVISVIRSDVLLSGRTLGQVICVPLIEHSHQSKTRVLALHECRSCVDRVGLSALGKKGLLVTAKTLSEESLPENRAAALDLMETVLDKLDGDVERLANICGTTYLSDNGKEMIEERWKKHSGGHQSASNQHLQRNKRSRRLSQIPSSRTAGINERKGRSATPKSPKSTRNEEEPTGALRDELPSFRLRLDNRKTAEISGYGQNGDRVAAGPFSFTFDQKQPLGGLVDTNDEFMSHAKISSMALETSSSAKDHSSQLPLKDQHVPKTEGAAASLRARLLKIRQKQKENESSPAAVQASLSPASISSPETEQSAIPAAAQTMEAGKKVDVAHEKAYDVLHSRIEELLHTEPPVPEDHPNNRECIAALKKYHAAVSDQPGAAPDLTFAEFSDLRQSITDKTVETIENLTSVIVYAFNCETPDNSAGMSIPILSVALATLMALFRDPGLSQNVTQDSLALLLREAGKALLDPRLAVSSHHAMASQLDESTSSQMVRAINKLAVQAATGSPRDVSIEALLALMHQLCTVGNDTAADAAFNGRLSRIVTKLFAKVLKAEAASPSPFSSTNIDVEAIICALDDMLVATDRQDAVDTCSNMGKSLLIPILNARGEGCIEEIRSMMDELGIDPQDSNLAVLLTSCETELDFSGNKSVAVVDKSSSTPPESPFRTAPSMNVASLVSELGIAAEGPEREAAVAALRRYNALHGDEHLHSHLSEVSDAFRAFIMEQLNESSSSPRPEESNAPKGREDNGQNSSVSERIRFLRSKLNATETSVQGAIDSSSTITAVADTTLPPENAHTTVSSPTTPSRKLVSEARLTPSRIPKMTVSATPQSTMTGGAGTALSLRERLAAAQKKRADAAAAAANDESKSQDTQGGIGGSISAYGHAASLRARLEAVKQQSKRS